MKAVASPALAVPVPSADWSFQRPAWAGWSAAAFAAALFLHVSGAGVFIRYASEPEMILVAGGYPVSGETIEAELVAPPPEPPAPEAKAEPLPLPEPEPEVKEVTPEPVPEPQPVVEEVVPEPEPQVVVEPPPSPSLS